MIDELRKYTSAQLAELIPHQVATDAITVSNILVPCATWGDRHCNGEKLLVPPNFMEFLEVLVQEINDPVIDFVVDNARSLVMDSMKFEPYNGEKIMFLDAKS